MALPPPNRGLPHALQIQEEAYRVEQELDRMITADHLKISCQVEVKTGGDFNQVYSRICARYEPLGWRVTGTGCQCITLVPK